MILPSIGGHIFPPVLQQQAEPTVNAAHACQKCAMPNNHNSGKAFWKFYKVSGLRSWEMGTVRGIWH
jgi:hypothetical protein